MSLGSSKWALMGVCAVTLASSGSAPLEDWQSHYRYMVGQPYQIAGTWYTPKEDWSYDETGIASWYGEQFQGRSTADGEIFDLKSLTAAHRTLPLPVVVRVTNLGNGRSLKLRVNDRGPFADDRIIDVSRRAARLLGFERSGVAKVRVEIEVADSLKVAAAAGRGSIQLSRPVVLAVVCAMMAAIGVWTLAIDV
jgi:rare lipoprotein A